MVFLRNSAQTTLQRLLTTGKNIYRIYTTYQFYWSTVTRQNVFGRMKKNALAARQYKPQCSQCGKKVAAYDPKTTVEALISRESRCHFAQLYGTE